MNLRKLLLVIFVVVLVCQLGFAQSVADKNVLNKTLTTAKQTGKPMPVVPVTAAVGPKHARPTIWVAGNTLAVPKAPAVLAGEPWFCLPGGFLFCPKSLTSAYQVSQITNGNGGSGMVIAIVDLYGYPYAENNLAQFNNDMGLPACTTANGCFTSIDLTGGSDGSGSGWDLESMLDLEYAHTMAPKAKLIYVQTSNLSEADDVAAKGCPASIYCLPGMISPPADIISNSWQYLYGEYPSEDPYFNQGKVVLFSSGDSSNFPYQGYPTYPCTSPYVSCVGGTSLYVNQNLQRTLETGWAGGGGGCSQVYAMPPWQGSNGSSVCTPNRATPDVSAIADPNTGVAVYLGNPVEGYYYYQVGGTSLATPVVAGLVANIDTARVSFGKTKLTYLNDLVYKAAASNYNYFLYDVTSGNNGYPAGFQFDLVTGLGVPIGKDWANRFFGLP